MPPKRKAKEASPLSDDVDEAGGKNHSMSDSEEETSKPKKQKKKVAKKQKLITESVTKKPKSNEAEGDAFKTDKNSSSYTIIDTEKTTKDGQKWNMKISSWNVAGLRAWVKKNGVEYIEKENPDILCLQETKCPEDKLPGVVKLPGYHTYWVDSVKSGYAGVALYSKEKPLKVTKGLNIEEHDNEGRVITAEYEKFYLVGTYVPNAGQGLKTLPKRLKWNTDFLNHLCELKEKKPVVLCGDLNVAHEKIDLARPDTNHKSAGFTPQERQGMTDLLAKGFIDTFRHLYPDVTGAYTFWAFFNNARAKNTGWNYRSVGGVFYTRAEEYVSPQIPCIHQKRADFRPHPVIISRRHLVCWSDQLSERLVYWSHCKPSTDDDWMRLKVGSLLMNAGNLRIDYFVISEDLLPNLVDNMIRKDVLGSDHCPITLYMHF